jgi:hypothetical protein
MPKKKISKKKIISKKNSKSETKPKKKSVKKSKKRLTKKQKQEIKENNEIEKLDQELSEVNLELKKLSLNNKKIIPFSEEEQEPSEGLASKGFRWELDSEPSDSSPSLEMINPPQRRLVPLEDVLEIDTSAPSPFNKNQNKQDEFNPFKYQAGKNQEDKNYASITQDYSSQEKQERGKKVSFIDLEKYNLLEGFPKSEINPVMIRGEDSLKDRKYIAISSFKNIERKPHDPFKKKSIEYEPLS